MVQRLLFFIAAIGALGGAVGVVLLRNPFYSVLALVVHLIVAGRAVPAAAAPQFVAAAQIVVYAGAVMVLYVFVVAYVGGSDEPLEPTPARRASLGAAARRSRCSSSSRIAVLGSALKPLGTDGADAAPPASARRRRSASCC